MTRAERVAAAAGCRSFRVIRPLRFLGTADYPAAELKVGEVVHRVEPSRRLSGHAVKLWRRAGDRNETRIVVDVAGVARFLEVGLDVEPL